MDPITAIALATKAVAELLTEVIKGQPLEVRTQVWEWWVKDQERWRKLLKLD